MNVRFLTAKAWLDADGEHVWFKHECLEGFDTSMLPHPQWHANKEGTKVEPSVDCRKCGCHTVVDLSPSGDNA